MLLLLYQVRCWDEPTSGEVHAAFVALSQLMLTNLFLNAKWYNFEVVLPSQAFGYAPLLSLVVFYFLWQRKSLGVKLWHHKELRLGKTHF